MNDLTMNGILNTVSAVVIGSTIIVSTAWIVTSIITAVKQRANTRARIEIYDKLIDKFQTAPEFIEFLKSDAGLRFIEEQSADVPHALLKILSSIRLGVSLALVGGGMVIVANLWDRALGDDLYVVLAMGGTIAMTAGVGFIVAAAVSYKLCKSWGLIPDRKAGNGAAQ